jgi:uncharacterized protein YdeI (YjbR/CyaY-like superfamily)
MGTRDPRIDAYIARSADFARPILTHLRELVHEACPEVEETIKWGFPHFVYRSGILCSMASFKEHCAFGFWKGAQVVDGGVDGAMGQFGRISSISDLPSNRILTGYIRKAMQLSEAGVKSPTRTKPKAAARKAVAVPDDLVRALRKNARARATFEGFSPSNQREYIEWIVEAKREETRQRRLETAIEWLAEGKPRNWKYMKS